jgi:ADP-ribosylglycohydrolase
VTSIHSLKTTLSDRIAEGLWGALVGDTLGVPVELLDREVVRRDPVTGMRGFGTHHQAPGTWSDDGSLILCTAESLLRSGFDTEDMGKRFVDWLHRGLWTAWGEVCDVGVATREALARITNGSPAETAGGRDEFSNGTG